MKRQLLKTIGRALIGVLIFAQMAIAAYACPTLLSSAATTMEMSSGSEALREPSGNPQQAGAQVAECGDMAGAADTSSPNLCAEHCRTSQQSDHASTLTVPFVLLTTLLITPYATDVAMRPRPAAAASSALASVDPPHASCTAVSELDLSDDVALTAPQWGRLGASVVLACARELLLALAHRAQHEAIVSLSGDFMFIVSFLAAPRGRRARLSLAATALCLTLTTLSAYAEPALTLERAVELAQQRSRQLTAQDAAASASREMAVAAGQLPDPTLKAGINNLPSMVKTASA